MAQVRILDYASAPWRPTTVQMTNLALIKTKWITVYLSMDTWLIPVYIVHTFAYMTGYKNSSFG